MATKTIASTFYYHNSNNDDETWNTGTIGSSNGGYVANTHARKTIFKITVKPDTGKKITNIKVNVGWVGVSGGSNQTLYAKAYDTLAHAKASLKSIQTTGEKGNVGSYTGNPDSSGVMVTLNMGGWNITAEKSYYVLFYTSANYDNDEWMQIWTKKSGNCQVPTLDLTQVYRTYTVDYKKGSYGTGTNTSATKTYGTALTLKGKTFTRTGYTQDGWSINSNGSTKDYNLSASYTDNSAITLYPHWRANKLKITFAANGGSIPSANQTSEDRVIKTDSADNIPKIYVKSSGNLYSFNKYTYVDNVYEHGLPDRGGQGLTTAPSGYTSTRVWEKTAGSGSSDFSETDTGITALEMASNLTTGDRTILLYAQWKKTLSITYNNNGGTGGPGVRSKDVYYPTTSYQFTVNDTDPTRTGYDFLGWSTSSTATSASYTSGDKINRSANLTLYAVWKAHTYSVKYNGNGSTSGSMSNSSHTYDTAKKLTANSFTRAYTVTFNANSGSTTKSSQTATYSFSGWATSASGSVAYSNQQEVKNLSSTNGATVNLYAKWSSASVTLPTASQCTRTGYTLLGFSTSNTATTASYNPGVSYTPTDNVTLYAVWSPKVCEITLNANGGTIGSTKKVWLKYNTQWQNRSGEAITSIAEAPSRVGYDFAGFYTDQTSGTKIINANKTFVSGKLTFTASDTTLYAHWTARSDTKYTVKHWQQNIDAPTTQNSTNYTVKDTQSLTGTSDASATPATKSYTGFNSPSTQTVTISANGSTVVDYYYTRKSFTVTLTKGTGIANVSGAGTYHYKKSVTINATTSTGYGWQDWTGTKASTTKNLTFEMPASDVSNTANGYPYTLTLIYNKNGGTQPTTNDKQMPYTSTVKYGNNYNGTNGLIDINTFEVTKTGYFANKWNTSADGTGYTIEQNVSYTAQALATACGKNLGTGDVTINLYPFWEAKELTVIFNKNDGSTSTASQIFKYGAAGNRFGYNTDGTLKWSPEKGSYADLYGFGHWYKEGYKILGWSESSSATAPTYSTYSGVSNDWIQGKIPGNNKTGTVNIYAVWDPMGLVRIWNGSSFQLAIPYIYTNEGWNQAMSYIYKNDTDKWKFGV